MATIASGHPMPDGMNLVRNLGAGRFEYISVDEATYQQRLGSMLSAQMLRNSPASLSLLKSQREGMNQMLLNIDVAIGTAGSLISCLLSR